MNSERMSEQELFRRVLSMQGKPAEVTLSSTGESLQGTIVNTMFDSFLLESNGKRRVVPFADILVLDDLN